MAQSTTSPVQDLSNIDVSNLTDEEIMKIELGFFKKLNAVDTTRDYSIIVDMSASMAAPGRWEQARDAVAQLAPHACKCDPDGITLYFFDYEFKKYSNVKNSLTVNNLFAMNRPRGTTDLAKVLTDAVVPDWMESSWGCCCFGANKAAIKRPETILVITDGVPDSKEAVERVIINATHKYMTKDDDLSITIIQVGDDGSADVWLKELDNGLQDKGAKFDVVDLMTHSMMKGKTFSEIISLSIHD